jgi:two-component system, chemotaxis family, response regulator Rcp1
MNERTLPIEILLIEDSEGDVRLVQEALKEGKLQNRLFVARDGVEGLDFLFKRGKYRDAVRPDLILLDLNMPKMDGREVLAEIKQHENLKCIPVVILTTSDSEADILKSYNLHANCYIVKPLNLDEFFRVVRYIETFWLSIVKLPIGGN